jgi:arsenate reductase
MSQLTIYHNPRCSKSRQTLALLEEKGIQPDVVHYLETPPAPERIQELLDLLGISARELMRSKEAPYQTLGLDDPQKTDAELIAAMSENPILIERPIVAAADRAVIGRPPENVLSLIEG